jgi:hypothetical protein
VNRRTPKDSAVVPATYIARNYTSGQEKVQKAENLVLRPAELGEGVLETGEREADDVKIAAFDARDEAAGAALDGVGFIVRFAGGEITGDLFLRKSGELHQRGFDESEPLGVGKADERDASDDSVGAAGKFFEHAAGVVGGTWFAEDVAFKGDFGVGGDDDGGPDGAGGDKFGFGDGQTLNEFVSGFARVSRFVDCGGKQDEGEARAAKNFSAAGRCGSEDQLHGIPGGEEYYSTRAVAACALVQPEGRAI